MLLHPSVGVGVPLSKSFVSVSCRNHLPSLYEQIYGDKHDNSSLLGHRVSIQTGLLSQQQLSSNRPLERPCRSSRSHGSVDITTTLTCSSVEHEYIQQASNSGQSSVAEACPDSTAWWMRDSGLFCLLLFHNSDDRLWFSTGFWSICSSPDFLSKPSCDRLWALVNFT